MKSKENPRDVSRTTFAGKDVDFNVFQGFLSYQIVCNFPLRTSVEFCREFQGGELVGEANRFDLVS